MAEWIIRAYRFLGVRTTPVPTRGNEPLATDRRPGRCEGDAELGPAQWCLEFGLGAPAGNRKQSLLVVLFAFFFSF